MTLSRTLSRTLPALLLAGLTSVTATAVLAPAPAQAAQTCTVWRSTGDALTGFARCTEFNGYPRFQVKVTCRNGATATGPVVRLGQTTWASCTSNQGYVAKTTILGWS